MKATVVQQDPVPPVRIVVDLSVEEAQRLVKVAGRCYSIVNYLSRMGYIHLKETADIAIVLGNLYDVLEDALRQDHATKV